MNEEKQMITRKKEKILFFTSIILLGILVIVSEAFLRDHANNRYQSNSPEDNPGFFFLQYYIYVELGGYFLAFILALIFSYFLYKEKINDSVSFHFFIYLALLVVLFSFFTFLLLYSNHGYKCNHIIPAYSLACEDKLINDIIDSPSKLSIFECNSIDSPKKADCIKKVAAVKKDDSLCNALPNYEIDRCLYDVANSSQDYSLCNKITDLQLKNYCTAQVAYVRNDLEKCYSLSRNFNIDFREFCIMNIALSHKDVSFCYNMTSETREDCFKELAIELKNKSLCFEIKGDEEPKKNRRLSCFEKIAFTTNDETLCFYLNNLSIDYCLKEILSKQNDWQKCNIINKVDEREHCLYRVATRLNNSEICKKISYTALSDECFDQIAWHTRNKLICNEITSKIKISCLSKFEKKPFWDIY